MADPYKDAPWQQGDILRADELNAMQMGLSPLGTIIPWVLPWNPTGADNDYSNVDKYAPFHLPCEGNIYPTSRAPDLSAALNHAFIPQVSVNEVYQVTASGDVPPNTSGFPAGFGGPIVVQDTRDWELEIHTWTGSVWRHDKQVDEGTVLCGLKEIGLRAPTDAQGISAGSLVPDAAVCRVDGRGHPVVIEADGFCTPDMRGRAPFGATGHGPSLPTGGIDVLAPIALGERRGDKKVGQHIHMIKNGHNQVIANQGPANGNAINYMQDGWGDYLPGTGWQAMSGLERWDHGGGEWPQVLRTDGVDQNMPPFTGLHFLIACGVSGSATPSTRSGEVHRLHPVTTDHMLRQRLADPNLPDDEREMYEAHLAGEPWPPPPDEPPATRTATTTRKTTTRKRKKS